jgi:menaquinone-dependent protoporphyrinogen oxidase
VTNAPTTKRRSAVHRIGLGLLGVTALASGFIGWGMHRPGIRQAHSSCAGGAPVKQRVLIAYATRAGSTGEVAQAIADQLCVHGFDADVRAVEAVTGLDGYGAVVLGSAIRYGAWLPEMLKFAQAQRNALAKLPVAIFTMHIQALDDNPQSRTTQTGYSQAMRRLVTPRAEAFFAGKVDPATLSFFERMAVKMVKSPIGDKRDWNRIRDWADRLGVLLR